MKLIVGLGNPGKRYDRTPHNVGFEVIDALSERLSCPLRNSLRFQARLGAGTWNDRPVTLMKPETFMNASGLAVGALMRKRGLTAGDLIVIVDDAALPVGQLRIRPEGSDGGHNGLRSIGEAIGSRAFARVRLGVGDGEPPEDLAGYVLAPFSATALAEAKKMVHQAAEAVLHILDAGVASAMNRFNAKPKQGRGGDG